MTKNEKLIPQFKINNLTKSQYEAALLEGTINADELYCVAESTDLELYERVANLDEDMVIVKDIATSAQATATTIEKKLESLNSQIAYIGMMTEVV